MDYGTDRLYMSLAEEAIAGWREWNRQSEQTLFHEDGFLFLTTEELRPGLFEFESYRLLQQHGKKAERISPAALQARFPAFNTARYRDGYLSLEAGWAESANAVTWVAQVAKDRGVRVREGVVMKSLLENGSRVTGVVLEGGESLRAEYTVVAGGPWSPFLVPDLNQFLRPVAQPIFYFQTKAK